MNIQEMLSKITPEQLTQGMAQMGLSPEQMNQVKNAVNSGKSGGFDNLNLNDIKTQLQNNPELAKQLQNAEMLSKISEIFKK